jgi:predicted aspartyl protease
VRLGETTVAILRNAPIITLFANGAAVTLLLDTGAETTVLTPAVALRIGAQRPRIEFQRQMRGIFGSLQTDEVELRSFTLGGLAIPWRRVRVAPVSVANVFSGPLDGVLGADTLSSFDVDLDLPRHRMALYAKPTCPNAVPAWTEPYARIGTGRSFGGHLFFPVQLDGRRIDAFIDTGAQHTVLSTKAASALGGDWSRVSTGSSHDAARCRGRADERARSSVFAAADRAGGHPQSGTDCHRHQAERCGHRAGDRFPEVAADLDVLRIAADLPDAPLNAS